MELMKMVVGQLWSAKREEEQAKALAKEDLAVANHRDASLLKSLQNSTHKIKKKHLGGQQPLREIVQTKAVAKAKEATKNGMVGGDSLRPKTAWPFGPSPGPFDDELPEKPKLYCQNPDCPGFAGKRSFKFHERIGRGAGGWHCNGCGMPWERSWKMAYCG